MIFLFIALLFFCVAASVFAVDFFVTTMTRSLQALGLAFTAAGLACWLIDILHAAGKF